MSMEKQLTTSGLGLHHIGKTKYYAPKKFFTVEDGEDVHIYVHPQGESKKDIRTAIYLAFIEPWDDQEEPKKVAGRYPNYYI